MTVASWQTVARSWLSAKRRESEAKALIQTLADPSHFEDHHSFAWKDFTCERINLMKLALATANRAQQKCRDFELRLMLPGSCLNYEFVLFFVHFQTLLNRLSTPEINRLACWVSGYLTSSSASSNSQTEWFSGESNAHFRHYGLSLAI